MNLRSLIINIICILFIIPLYYITKDTNIFLYTYSIYLYLILSSIFINIDIYDKILYHYNKNNIYSMNTIYKYTNKLVIIINIFLSLIILISSILLNNLFDIKGFVIVNFIMSLTLFIKPLLNNIKSFVRVYNYNKLADNLIDIYKIISFIIKLITLIISYKVLNLSIYKVISILYLSDILSFILIYLLCNYLVLSIKINKKQFKKKEERINYKNEIKDVLSRNNTINIERIFKCSYSYISIIILYFILKNKYGYSYELLSSIINNFYLYGSSLIYIFILIFKFTQEKKYNKDILLDEYLINIFKKLLTFLVIISLLSKQIWFIIFGNDNGYILYMLSNITIFYLIYDIIVSITKLNISKKKLYIIFSIGIITKLISIVPLINSVYRLGYNLLYGDLLSNIISFIIVIVLLLISIKNKYKLNLIEKFSKILNVIYYNIILCIILLLLSLIVKLKIVSRIYGIKVIIIYLIVSYLYIYLERKRSKNERIIIGNKIKSRKSIKRK